MIRENEANSRSIYLLSDHKKRPSFTDVILVLENLDMSERPTNGVVTLASLQDVPPNNKSNSRELLANVLKGNSSKARPIAREGLTSSDPNSRLTTNAGKSNTLV